MERPWNGRCHRCGGKSLMFIMSRFNTDMLCEACETKEKNHPQYKAAREAEEAAVRAGNTNFPGIGKPVDL